MTVAMRTIPLFFSQEKSAADWLKALQDARSVIRRQAALADIYRISNENEKSSIARKKGIALARQIVTQYPETDWKARAADLIYKLENAIPVYGSMPE